MKDKILIVCAHPDDEVLGMGATVAKKVAEGAEVGLLILGDGETSRKKGFDIEKRENAAYMAAESLGIKQIYSKQFPDQKFDTIPLLEINRSVEDIVKEFSPNIVYTHHVFDLNLDHQITAKSVLTACRPQPGFPVRKIASFEVLSSTEWQTKRKEIMFCPNEYEDVTDFIDRKIEAMNYYRDELRKFPHPRSVEGIKALSNFRGIEVGYHNAEAFHVVRNLND